MMNLGMHSFYMEEKCVPCQHVSSVDLSLPPPCQFLTSLSVFGMAAALQPPQFACPHIPVAPEHSTAKRDGKVWGGWERQGIFLSVGCRGWGPRPWGGVSCNSPCSAHRAGSQTACAGPPGPSLPHLPPTASCLPQAAVGWMPCGVGP